MFNKGKRTGILAAVLIVSLAIAGLTGCDRMKDTEPADSASSSPTENTVSPDTSVQPSDTDPADTVSPTADNQADATASQSPSAENDYYGQWIVQKVQAYGPVGTYGSEDAEKLVGETLGFSDDEATILGEVASDSPMVIQDPVYEETVITSDEFSDGYRMSFDDMGISADSVAKVDVSSPQTAGGCSLLIKDDSSMILVVGGTYFALTRVE